MKTSASLRPALLLLAFGLLAPAHAGSLTESAVEAEKLVSAGKPEEAYDLMRKATSELGSSMKLGIRRAMFVSERPVAFGAVKGAASNIFPVGSTLITYTEPSGLSWVEDGNGRFVTRFTVDFELRNPDGEVLAAQKAFGNFSLASREKLQEVFTPLTLDVSSVPKGDYVIRYVFTDQNNKATASVDQRFTLK
jgi:hypothetical protein